jgi:hypothetical protein
MYVTLFSLEQETYKEKMDKASDNGTITKRCKPGLSSLTQQSHVSPYSSQVSAGIAAQMAAIEDRANAAEDDARVGGTSQGK